MAVVNARIRGGLPRGTAMPLLLDPIRGTQVPHAEGIADPTTRADVIAFIRSR